MGSYPYFTFPGQAYATAFNQLSNLLSCFIFIFPGKLPIITDVEGQIKGSVLLVR